MHDTSPSNEDEIDVLLVEDNPGDARLTREAFESTKYEVALRTVTNGDDAMELLRTSTDDELPDLILLDLYLPDRDGCEVLEVIRDDPRLRPLPVVILTSSEAEADITRCYDARANAYLTKPTDPDEFVSLIDVFEGFWVEQAWLPSIPQ